MCPLFFSVLFFVFPAFPPPPFPPFCALWLSFVVSFPSWRVPGNTQRNKRFEIRFEKKWERNARNGCGRRLRATLPLYPADEVGKLCQKQLWWTLSLRGGKALSESAVVHDCW